MATINSITQSEATISPASSLMPFPSAAAAISPEILSRVRRLTVGQYDQMTAAGLIAEDEPVELIEGLVLTKMPKNRPHIVAGKKGLKMLSSIIPAGWHVAKDDPVVASDCTKPEPDLAIVRGNAEDYLDRDVTAADVAVVIEIAESSLSVDQTEMARVYASSGIAAYWIVNIVDRQLEVYTSPGPEGYQSSQMLKLGQEIAVVIDGHEVGRIAVVDLLP